MNAGEITLIFMYRLECLNKFRWITAPRWEMELKCDGNEVAVGACSSAKHADCPGKDWD